MLNLKNVQYTFELFLKINNYGYENNEFSFPINIRLKIKYIHIILC